MEDSSKRLIQIPLRKPKFGFESFTAYHPGCYLLFKGPGALMSLAVTYGGAGSVYFVDVDPLEDNDGYYWENQIWKPSPEELLALAGREPEIPKGIGYPLYSTTPPQVGFYSLNSGVKHGLGLVVYGGEHRNIAYAGCYYNPAKS